MERSYRIPSLEMDLKCRSMWVVLLSTCMHPVVMLKMLVKCFIRCSRGSTKSRVDMLNMGQLKTPMVVSC